MISRDEFEKEVKELVRKDRDNENLKYLSNSYSLTAILIGVFSLVGLFASFPLTFAVGFSLGPVLMILCIIGIIVAVARGCNISKASKYYEKNYLDKVIAILLKDSKFSWAKDKYIDEEIFDESKFGGSYDRYNGSDLLTINIPNDDNSESDNNLVLCDLVVEKESRDSEGNTDVDTVYKGVFGYASFPCEFKCRLFLNGYSFFSGLEKVELEDIEFNRAFRVSSNDQVEARYILTPVMMEKLLSLKKRAGEIKITMIKDKLYIGFEDLDLFEMKNVKEGNIESMFRDFYDVIRIIMDVVEEMKNNNKVFKF